MVFAFVCGDDGKGRDVSITTVVRVTGGGRTGPDLADDRVNVVKKVDVIGARGDDGDGGLVLCDAMALKSLETSGAVLVVDADGVDTGGTVTVFAPATVDTAIWVE